MNNEEHMKRIVRATGLYVAAEIERNATLIEAWHDGVPVELIAGAAKITPESVSRIVGTQ